MTRRANDYDDALGSDTRSEAVQQVPAVGWSVARWSGRNALRLPERPAAREGGCGESEAARITGSAVRGIDHREEVRGRSVVQSNVEPFGAWQSLSVIGEPRSFPRTRKTDFMASALHQPQRREKIREFRPLGMGVSDPDAWSRMSREERAAWMRRRQELKQLLTRRKPVKG